MKSNGLLKPPLLFIYCLQKKCKINQVNLQLSLNSYDKEHGEIKFLSK